jgi:hypothetical protein
MRNFFFTTILLPTLALAAACNESNFKGQADKINPTVVKDFKQDEYPVVTTSHTQGHQGEPQDENFEQGEWGKLDILVVIDNSVSMVEEQKNLAAKLEPLLSHVEKADWQIAVITTYDADNCQRALIKKTDADAKTKFANAVNAGVNQNAGLERGILRAVVGLKAECKLQPWLRTDSTLAVLIVSDEDNCSLSGGTYGCQGKPDLNSNYLFDYISTIRKPGVDAKVYGLLWHSSTPQDSCKTGYSQGKTYEEVIEKTGGKWGSICDADYSTTLRAMSQDIAQIVKYEFPLAHMPDDGTLQILVDNQNWDKFVLEGQTVKFTQPPPFGSKVVVNYRHGKEGDLLKTFPLEKVPVSDSIYVDVAGTKVTPGTYRWDDNLKKVVFDVAPTERAAVKITYKEKVALKNEFLIGMNVNTKTLVVLVNDVVIKDVTYDSKTGMIKIAPTPTEGASIKVSYQAL